MPSTPQPPDPAPARPTASAAPPSPPRWSSPRGLVALCTLIVVATAAVRTWVAAAGWFYWDDLLLHTRAAHHDLPGPGLLFADHDGHLMPGGMALAWINSHLAPLDFRLPLLEIALLQLLAGAALARLLWVLLRGRPVLLAPLLLASVVPLGLPAATWWAAAVNALPLSAAMAWAAASTVRLAETGRRRHAVGAVAATVVGLVFVEKSVLVPVVAAAVLWGWWWIAPVDDDEARTGDRERRPPRRALWRRTRSMWAAQLVVLAAWAAAFVAFVGRIGFAEDTPDVADTVDPTVPGPSLWELIDHTYRLAVGPTLAGGPWRWGRWHPGPPMADPPVPAIMAGALLGAAVLVWALFTRRRTGALWIGVALYPLVSVLLVSVARVGPDTATEIVQTLRYHADATVVLAAALALALAAPRRSGPDPSTTVPAGSARAGTARTQRWALAGLVLVVVVSSSVSTVAYRAVWAEQPSRDYFEPLMGALEERDAPMLDTPVPLEVLLPVTHPDNLLSRILHGVPGVPAFAAWTSEPVVVDAEGTLHPADVVPGRTMTEGAEPACGHRIAPDGTRIALDGPLLGRDWVLRLNHFADSAGTVAVRLDHGEEVEVPVPGGLSTVYVRVEGSGEGVTVTPREGVSDLCVGRGSVGVLVPR